MSATERPNLVELFTPTIRGIQTIKPLESLAWVLYCEGVHVAAVPAKLIDGTLRGVAGWVAKTTPKRTARQENRIAWVGFLRVKVADGANKPTETVYHVGAGGPLFATREAAGEAAKVWRFGATLAEQKAFALDLGAASSKNKAPTGAQKAVIRRILANKATFADKKRLPALRKAGWLTQEGALTPAGRLAFNLPERP